MQFSIFMLNAFTKYPLSQCKYIFSILYLSAQYHKFRQVYGTTKIGIFNARNVIQLRYNLLYF